MLSPLPVVAAAGDLMNSEPALQLSWHTCRSELAAMPRPIAGEQLRLALAGTRNVGQLTSSAHDTRDYHYSLQS